MPKSELQDQTEKIKRKLGEIYDDLEFNVTHTYGRQDLLFALDLAYHSILRFRFNGIMLQKGWVEILVLGDARCGKTQTLRNLMRHYRAGEFCTGENASFAGLIGGMQQIMGKTWSITWGLIPLQNRRLVGIDEVSGLAPEAIADMSGVRSEGIATITKIQREQTAARTRLIWMSNPRKPRPLRSYNAGVEAVTELIGRPEDVARFDFCVTVATNEVDVDVINMETKSRRKVEHRYTSQRCHDLVLWAWSRRPDDVIFTDEATTLCLTRAKEFGKRYHPSIPLVEAAEQRIKLAKLAAALAARLHNSPDDKKVLVEPAHVQFICDYLDQVYSKESLSYDLYSRHKFSEETLKDPNAVVKKFAELHSDMAETLLDNQYFSLADLELFANIERVEARDLASFLIRQRCLKRIKGSLLIKTPAFIQFLKEKKLSLKGKVAPDVSESQSLAKSQQAEI